MSITSRAVKESKDVARLAVDAAKNELIEQLTPTIKAIIDGQLRAGTLSEDIDALEGVNRMRQAQDYDGITDFEEGKEMKDKKDKVESVSALFPGISEMYGEDVEEAKIKGNSKDDNGYDDVDEELQVEADDEEMDEDLEISESELESMYAEALQLEVDVTKGFKDMAKPHEFGAGAKAQYQSDPANLADMKSGEAQWDNVKPPEQQDYIPENIRQLVRQGLAENKTLMARNAKLTEMVKKLHGKLSEMNLLNSKILHVNKFMTAHRLNTEQKKAVIESIDKGNTVKEVKSIYSILESSFKAAGAVTESTKRAAKGNAQRARTSGSPDPRVLRESADKEEGGGVSRWQTLAGLNKIVSG